MIRSIAEGSPEPLGVTPRDGGVNVAVFSANAGLIEFCLFDAAGERELARLPLTGRTGDIHHAFVAEVPPGSRYGLRAHGPYDPASGHRFNPHKLLIDPYATMLDRRFALHASMFAHETPDGAGFSRRDSAPFMPKAIVRHAETNQFAGKRPEIPWRDTVLYELNVRGFSKRRLDLPEAVRGTFTALSSPASIAHFQRLGVTAIEVMPAAAWIDERHLGPLGLTNAWGYNPVALGAPDPRLAPGGWEEIRQAVAALHEAGIEVLLDVVLNHTGEGDELGPTLSFRGLDNASYFRLRPDDPARYIDDMGCGNCLALDRPHLVRLCMESLRGWAGAGIDGFRFDLATALGRRPEGFDPDAPLIAAIRQDPDLRGLKLIAEAWDVGPGGYQVGRFPAEFGEWNDRYRDAARRFWRGDAGAHREMATRFAGSHDLFAGKGRPSRSINFVTAHDGFTLADLVAHEHKHNLANGESNRDGTDENQSWNHGVEGPSDDPAVLGARHRDQLNLLATLLFSRGTPMLAMGSELGHSQSGNNNAYAQDNDLTWLDWSAPDEAVLQATQALVAARRSTPVLTEDRFLTGTAITLDGLPDARWLTAAGGTAGEADWSRDFGETLLLELASESGTGPHRALLVLHRGAEPLDLVLPQPRPGHAWRRQADTATPPERWGRLEAASHTNLGARSVVLFAEAATEIGAGKLAAPTDAVIDRLADEAGIYRDWWDHAGGNHAVGIETKRIVLRAMGFDTQSLSACRDAIHHLKALRLNAQPPSPEPCWLPGDRHRGSGIAGQLYALRRRGDQGIGDLTTLALAATQAAGHGACVFGINPLHALFPDDRHRASPYHPSDRRFLDEIYIDLEQVAAMPGGAEVGRALSGESRLLEQLRARPDIDYETVGAFKRRILRTYFAGFRSTAASSAPSELHRDFEAFCRSGGEAIKTFAAYRTIQARHPGLDWRDWPGGLGAAGSQAVRDWMGHHAEDLRFECFMQWLADRQLAEAAAAARVAGLRHGLYRDLAVGCAPDGAEIWASRASYATGVSIGAPPDPFSASGQIWNLPPLNPHGMAADGFAFFRSLIAANMRHAGMLRIDHAMGLMRLFWVPDGARTEEGAYVAYPLQHLLGVVSEESRSHRCMVVGEDLGTVPDGFREALTERAILSYRVLWFERNDQGFRAPEAYPRLAAACISTHDIATLAGWWSAQDLIEKARLGLIADIDAARTERRDEKAAVIDLLIARGSIAVRPDPEAPLTDPCAAALHRLIADTPSLFAFAQADDLCGATQAVNLPGTDRERPNWRHRLPDDVEDMFGTPRALAILAALRARH